MAYTYDGFNRTQKVETFDGKVQINHYDAEGLRHEIEENSQLVQFIFNNEREVIVEKNASDTIRLIRGYDITASESEQARTYYHYVSDELGSTTHIFAGQELRNYYEYDAFGNLTTCEEQVANRFKYTGQQQDPITQQYYLRARYYNPIIARFTQEDTYRGDGLNLYAYCDNNPVIYYDPSGHQVCVIKELLYKHLHKQIDPRIGEIRYTASEAYQRACQQANAINQIITIDRYKTLSKDKNITGQAHHLNQNAAFRPENGGAIPMYEGVSLKLVGDAFVDMGTPHNEAHYTMEEFWDAYRPPDSFRPARGQFAGQRPTIKEYNKGLYR